MPGLDIKNFDKSGIKTNSGDRYYEYVFDKRDRIVILYKCDNNKQRKTKQFFEYNTEGQLIETIELSENAIIFKRVLYKYNEYGLTLEEIEEFAGKLKKKTLCEYNELNLLTKETVTENFHDYKELSTIHFVYMYNELGLISEISRSNNNELYCRNSKKYNDVNRIIQSIFFDKNGNIEKSEVFEYDEAGNWTTHRNSGKSFTLLVERKIECY